MEIFYAFFIQIIPTNSTLCNDPSITHKSQYISLIKSIHIFQLHIIIKKFNYYNQQLTVYHMIQSRDQSAESHHKVPLTSSLLKAHQRRKQDFMKENVDSQQFIQEYDDERRVQFRNFVAEKLREQKFMREVDEENFHLDYMQKIKKLKDQRVKLNREMLLGRVSYQPNQGKGGNYLQKNEKQVKQQGKGKVGNDRSNERKEILAKDKNLVTSFIYNTDRSNAQKISQNQLDNSLIHREPLTSMPVSPLDKQSNTNSGFQHYFPKYKKPQKYRQERSHYEIPSHHSKAENISLKAESLFNNEKIKTIKERWLPFDKKDLPIQREIQSNDIYLRELNEKVENLSKRQRPSPKEQSFVHDHSISIPHRQEKHVSFSIPEEEQKKKSKVQKKKKSKKVKQVKEKEEESVEDRAIKRIKNRLSLSNVVFEDSQHRIVAHEKNHLKMKLQMEEKQRKELLNKICSNKAIKSVYGYLLLGQ